MAGAKQNKSSFLVDAWYQKSSWLYLLLPVSLLYWLLISLRKWFYNIGVYSVYRAKVPVIVVGNITVGGTGKSPVVVALVRYLQEQGYKPGVISRGYGSRAPSYPFLVNAQSDPLQSGDEPLMIAKSANVPVMISPNRGDAIDQLLAKYDCDMIISDDGLQHHALARDVEVVVVDGVRQFGNGLLLPMGPLREPIKRLSSVDFRLYNGGNREGESNCYNMQLSPQPLINLADNATSARPEEFDKVHAVSGIGNPQRFFNTLRKAGFDIIEHAFDDHYAYKPQDLEFGDDLPIVMTEKDAVKVSEFSKKNYWYLPVTASIDNHFFQKLQTCLSKLSINKDNI